MLSTIKNAIDSLEYVNYQRIKNLKDSCCQSEALVIDYDAVKDGYCTVKSMTSLGSADGFNIDIQNNRIVFIEMKSVSSIVEHLDKRNKLVHPDAGSFISHCISEMEIKSASCIIDSIALFFALLSECGINSEYVSKCLNKENVNIKFFWVVEINSEDYITYTLSTFASKHKYRILQGGKLDVIQASAFASLYN